MSLTKATLRTPIVSVITPSHNRAQFVSNAIVSALKQTCRDIEVILVEDNSQDNTEELVKSIRDDRVRYIKHTTRRGGGAARNTGIKAAKGQYIAFLDDDDEWLSDKLEKQLDAIDSFDVILCAARLKSNGKIDHHYKKSTIELKDLRRGFVFGGGTSSILAKSSIMKENLFDEELMCDQDWGLMLRLASKYQIKYIRDPLVIYNDGIHNRISTASINMPICHLEQRMCVVYKHRELMGPFWSNYQMARKLLEWFKFRDNKLKHLLYTIRRCDLLPVLMVCYLRVKKEVEMVLERGREQEETAWEQSRLDDTL